MTYQASKKTDLTVDLIWWDSLRLTPIINVINYYAKPHIEYKVHRYSDKVDYGLLSGLFYMHVGGRSFSLLSLALLIHRAILSQ